MRKLVFVAALLVMASVSSASASTVSYISGDNIWLSSPDGTQKVKLSGPAGDGRVWTEQAQADNGSVLGVRREPNKVAPLNSFTLWGPDGKKVNQGSLGNEPGWSTYAYPVSLDLTADGKQAAYGYANTSGFYPTQQFEFGTYVTNISQGSFIQPIKIAGVEWPTINGTRVVGAIGDQVGVQAAASAPFGPDFAPWINIDPSMDLHRTDTSAQGNIVAIELDDGTTERIVLAKTTALGGDFIGTGDCFMPTQGDATRVSLSADGKTVAWQDDRGVVTSGLPDFAGTSADCNLTAPVVVLAADGKFPSVGAAKLITNGGGGGEGSPVISPPSKIKASKLKKGIQITVKVKKAGKVTLTGKVNGKVVARGSVMAKKAGPVKVKLKAVASSRKKLSKLKGKTMVIKVTSGGKSASVKRKVR